MEGAGSAIEGCTRTGFLNKIFFILRHTLDNGIRDVGILYSERGWGCVYFYTSLALQEVSNTSAEIVSGLRVAI
jgi:hypothetical protein